ncbi:MAG: hypothetical protein EOO56_13035 [Hymenobacter sp.]|nr:MAG: hypothetical protein EOO56_13035 [Hymenobacter sp.]
MDIKYLSDTKGAITGVFIPIADWEHLQKQYNISFTEPAAPNPQLKQGLADALKKANITPTDEG